MNNTPASWAALGPLVVLLVGLSRLMWQQLSRGERYWRAIVDEAGKREAAHQAERTQWEREREHLYTEVASLRHRLSAAEGADG